MRVGGQRRMILPPSALPEFQADKVPGENRDLRFDFELLGSVDKATPLAVFASLVPPHRRPTRDSMFRAFATLWLLSFVPYFLPEAMQPEWYHDGKPMEVTCAHPLTLLPFTLSPSRPRTLAPSHPHTLTPSTPPSPSSRPPHPHPHIQPHPHPHPHPRPGDPCRAGAADQLALSGGRRGRPQLPLPLKLDLKLDLKGALSQLPSPLAALASTTSSAHSRSVAPPVP